MLFTTLPGVHLSSVNLDIPFCLGFNFISYSVRCFRKVSSIHQTQTPLWASEKTGSPISTLWENQTQMLNKEEDDVIRAAVPHFTITWVWRRGWQFHTRCLSFFALGPIWERFFITGFVFFSLQYLVSKRTRSKEFGLMWSLPNTHCEVSQVVLINPLLSVYYLHLYKLIWKYNEQYTMCRYGYNVSQNRPKPPLPISDKHHIWTRPPPPPFDCEMRHRCPNYVIFIFVRHLFNSWRLIFPEVRYRTLVFSAVREWSGE